MTDVSDDGDDTDGNTTNDSTIVEIGGGDGLSVAGNLTVAGNMTVTGSTTTVSSTNTTLADQFIELGTGRTGSASGDSGLVIERGSDANAFIGFDESADELLGELSPMAMRLIGIAIFRAALCGAVVVGLRDRVPRTLCIAACGGCVVYGRTRSDRDFEFLGYRAVFVPLVAWLASYMSLTFVFDVVVYAITFGALEWEK